MKNTLLARMGFEDHELKTPLHDEICMWAYMNVREIAGEASAALVRTGRSRGLGDSYIVEKVEWEKPVMAGNGSIIGFHDLWIGLSRSCCSGFGVEVKSSIRSAGELIRQLKTTGTRVVVCPDDRFAELLRGQGFGFVKYPGPIHVSGDLFNV